MIPEPPPLNLCLRATRWHSEPVRPWYRRLWRRLRRKPTDIMVIDGLAPFR